MKCFLSRYSYRKQRPIFAAADFLREIGRTDQQYFSCASAYSNNQLEKEYAPRSEPDAGERRRIELIIRSLRVNTRKINLFLSVIDTGFLHQKFYNTIRAVRQFHLTARGYAKLPIHYKQ